MSNDKSVNFCLKEYLWTLAFPGYWSKPSFSKIWYGLKQSWWPAKASLNGISASSSLRIPRKFSILAFYVLYSASSPVTKSMIWGLRSQVSLGEWSYDSPLWFFCYSCLHLTIYTHCPVCVIHYRPLAFCPWGALFRLILLCLILHQITEGILFSPCN